MTLAPSQTETDILSLSNNITSCLSLVGGAWILCAFLRAPRFWSITGKMIICLTIADFIYAISNLLSNLKSTDSVCQLSGFLRTFGSLSSFVWAVKIARMAFEVFRDREVEVDPELYSWFHLIKSFAFPLAFAFV